MSTTLASIGRERVLTEAVEAFYDLVLADGRLAGYFDGVDITRLKQEQVGAFSAALDGPGSRAPRSAEQVHQVRGIDPSEFDLVVCYLADALREAGVPDRTINEVLFTLAPLARDIVSVTAPAPVPNGARAA